MVLKHFGMLLQLKTGAEYSLRITSTEDIYSLVLSFGEDVQ